MADQQQHVLQATLRVETSILRSPCTPPAVLQIGPADLTSTTDLAWPSNFQTTGGSIVYSHYAPIDTQFTNHTLLWQLDPQDPTTLKLSEVDCGTLTPTHSISLKLPANIFPSVAAFSHGAPSPTHLCLAFIIHTGHLVCVTFPLPSPSCRQPSGLSALTAASATLHSIHTHLQTLGTPTTLTTCDTTLCIGTRSGTFLCFPTPHLPRAQPPAPPTPAPRPFHLHDSSWSISRLIQGVLSRPKHLGVVAAFQISFPQKPALLASLHEDCILRIWNPKKQQQLGSELLESDASANNLLPVSAAVFPDPAQGAGVHQLAVMYEGREGDGKTHAVLYLLNAPAEKLMLRRRVELQGLTAGGAMMLGVQLHERQLWSVVQASGWETGFEAAALIVGHDPESGVYSGGGVLAEQQLPRGGGSGPQVAVQQELLASCLDSLPSTPAPAGPLPARAPPASHPTADAHFWRLLSSSAWLCRASLAAVLCQAGDSISFREASEAPLGQLRSRVQAAVLAIQHRMPGCSYPGAWQALLGSYTEIWSRQHPPLALVHLPAGQLACLRGGLTLSLLRPASLAEVWETRFASSEGTAKALPGRQGDVVGALQLMRMLLGQPCHSAVTSFVFSGQDPITHVVPHYTDLLVRGPSPPHPSSSTAPPSSAASADTDSVREARGRWRAGRQKLLVNLLNVLSDLSSGEDFLEVIRHIITETSLKPTWRAPTPSHASASTANLSSAAGAAAAAAVAAQCSAAQFSVVADLALLVALLRRLRPQLEPDLASLAAELEPQLRLAAATAWLTSTVVSEEDASEAQDSAAQALSQLRLGARPALASGPAPALASALLPAFQHDCPAVVRGPLEQVGVALAAYVQHGRLPGRLPDSPTARALEAGAALFAAGEQLALVQLVGLAGPRWESSPGLLLLRGVGLVRQLRAEKDAKVRERRRAAAASSLLRAASGIVDAEEGLEQLRQLLDGLTAQVQGLPPPGGIRGPALQLHVLQIAAALFDREGDAATACSFVRAALDHVPCPTGLYPATPASIQLQGHLWSRIFSFACRLHDWDGAYTAMTAHPDPRRSLECARNLVTALLEAGALHKLCTLPWAGARQLSPPTPAASAAAPAAGDGAQPEASCSGQRAGGEVAVLAEEVAETMLMHARRSDVRAAPQPYRALHAFLVARGGFRAAARVMLEYEALLRAEAPEEKGAAVDALGCALQCLNLTAPEEAWVALSDPSASPHDPPALLTHEDVRRKFALASAELQAEEARGACIAADGMFGQTPGGRAGARGSSSLAEDCERVEAVFDRLLGLGMHEAAMQLAGSCWEGARRVEGFRSALQSLAADCTRRHIRDETGGRPGPSMREASATDSLAEGPSHLGSRAAAGWNRLRGLMREYQQVPEVQQRVGPQGLCLAVAEGVLAADLAVCLPAWLVESFEPTPNQPNYSGMSGALGGPTALVQLYLKYNRLVAAAGLCSRHLAAWNTVLPVSRQRAAGVWFPYPLLSTLHERLAAAAGAAAAAAAADPAAAALAEQLREGEELLGGAVRDHFALLKNDDLNVAMLHRSR